MLHGLFKTLDQRLGLEEASAHCDIPCKIYDPSTAQIAALTVVRLIDLMNETADGNSYAFHNTFTRLVMEKEEQAELVKHEIRIIWGDYIKAPQIEKFPNIHELAHSIMLKGSACKQHGKREDGEALVELVNEFADIFWQTKGVATKRVKCPYPPELEVVVPDL